LANDGFEVTGIDLSPEMIEIAKEQYGKKNKKLTFVTGDATNFSLGKKFDAVLSLFHVIDYHITNEALENSFKVVVDHLVPGGLFVFDCWYGPSILTDKPSTRVKKFEDNETEVVRLSQSTLFENENIVHVKYDILVIDKKSKKVDQIEEIHKVRYLFKPEILSLMKRHGVELVNSEEWLTGKDPSCDTWGVCFVGRKK
jgi:SAM-dependent methyltransferase